MIFSRLIEKICISYAYFFLLVLKCFHTVNQRHLYSLFYRILAWFTANKKIENNICNVQYMSSPYFFVSLMSLYFFQRSSRSCYNTNRFYFIVTVLISPSFSFHKDSLADNNRGQ